MVEHLRLRANLSRFHGSARFHRASSLVFPERCRSPQVSFFPASRPRSLESRRPEGILSVWIGALCLSLSLSLSLSRCQISNQRSGEISDRRESVAGLARVGSRSIGADTGESKVAASVQQDAFYNSSMLYSRRCRRRTIPGSGATSRAIQADRSSIDSAHSRRLDRDTFVFE